MTPIIDKHDDYHNMLLEKEICLSRGCEHECERAEDGKERNVRGLRQ